MKAIHGNLDISKKWKLIDSYYGDSESMEYLSCENCGMTIKNIAIVESETGDRKRIGLDCASTLTSIDAMELEEAKKRVRRQAKLWKFLKTECKSLIIGEHMIWAYKRFVDKWDVGFTYRLSKKFWYPKIESLAIPMTEEV